MSSASDKSLNRLKRPEGCTTPEGLFCFMNSREFLLKELAKKGYTFFGLDTVLTADISEVMDSYVAYKNGSVKTPLQERQDNFINSIAPYVEEYGKPMCMAFFNYWSETNKKGKMRFELEKTWEVGKRLVTWKNNSKNFINGKQDKRGELDSLEAELRAKFGV